LCNGATVYKKHLRGANTRQLTNELTESRYRWLIAQSCTYCGEPAGGVDRVKNDYGYTTLNSVACCSTCNFLKRAFDAPTFIAHAHKIVAHSATYEEFKTRWVETRTTGPDLSSTTTSTNSNSGPTNSVSPSTVGGVTKFNLDLNTRGV
jgi:hypothetical protein